MVIVHTDDTKTKERLQSMTQFIVVPTSTDLIVHGQTKEIMDAIASIGEETHALISIEAYDGGNVSITTINGPTGNEEPAHSDDRAPDESAPEQESNNGKVEADISKTAESEALEMNSCDGNPDEPVPEAAEHAADHDLPEAEETQQEPEVESREPEESEKKPEQEPATKTPEKKQQKEKRFKDAEERKLPPILPVPGTSFTAEEAISKLEGDKKYLTENTRDSLYVLDILCERCRKDQDFVQYVMREGKTFFGSYEYLVSLAKASSIGSYLETNQLKMVDLSRDDAVQYFIEYFMIDDDEIARIKKEEDEKIKAERAAKAAEKARNTREKKKKEKTKANPGLLDGIEVPKTEPVKPVPAEKSTVNKTEKPAKPVEKKPEQQKEQLDMFSMLDMVV